MPALAVPSDTQVCRNEERGREAVERVRRDSGNNDVHLKASTSWQLGWGGTPMAAADIAAGLLGWCQRQLTCHCCCGALLAPQVCDLASLAAIRALAEEWLASGAPLDLLVNK